MKNLRLFLYLLLIPVIPVLLASGIFTFTMEKPPVQQEFRARIFVYDDGTGDKTAGKDPLYELELIYPSLLYSDRAASMSLQVGKMQVASGGALFVAVQAPGLNLGDSSVLKLPANNGAAATVLLTPERAAASPITIHASAVEAADAVKPSRFAATYAFTPKIVTVERSFGLDQVQMRYTALAAGTLLLLIGTAFLLLTVLMDKRRRRKPTKPLPSIHLDGMGPTQSFLHIRFFNEISDADVALVGGKNASLGEMFNRLSDAGVKVPFGFATTSEAYRLFIAESGLDALIEEVAASLDPSDLAQLAEAGTRLRSAILDAEIPEALADEIRRAYRRLCRFYDGRIDVAVRSSATAEDLPDASFAGQQETFLNVSGEEALLDHIRRCYASLFTDRAISYRHSHGYDHTKIALCAGVQKMVRSDKAASGVMFTIDPDSGSERLVVVNAIWGLGENIVGGKTNPDEFTLFKPTLREGFGTILNRSLGSKLLTMVYDETNSSGTVNTDTSAERQGRYCISDDEAVALARYGMAIEEHYSERNGRYTPMDIEWAKDGENGELYIVQARPETVHSKKLREPATKIETYILAPEQEKRLLVSGTAVGEKIASGRVRHIRDTSEFGTFEAGEILLTDITDPDWEPVMKMAAGVITNRGGRTCHAAIVAREIGIPAVVGCSDATQRLQDGQEVTISCAEGETGYVYEGVLEHHVGTIDLGDLPEPRTHLYMNVGDPSKAFALSRLPNHGVGLARMEFIINHAIQAHPNALLDLYKGNPVDAQEAIEALTAEYDDPKSFFIGRLSEGIATIAAAFYPKPVIVRTSDFKSNEYKHMLGGARYEPDEENPMIGYRGASRYYSEGYREAFEWECEALKRVRDEMGLTNLIVMIPFVRTPEEGRKVVDIMASMGLEQGVNGLKVYAMCEIPSNVILADKFLEIFDGYSIGSNDLTQLTLGVDRGSDLIAHVFDERNEAVTRMLSMAIDACKKADKYIGICGQAPSDYPEISEFLVRKGITSISLNPDSILKTWKQVCELETPPAEQ